MAWLELFAVSAAVFFALGWPADTLARDESPRSGLLWGALTFALPGVVWLIVGALAPSHPSSETYGLVFFFGAASSCVAILLGTLTARGVRRRRS